MKLNLTVAALAAGTSLLFAGTAAAEVTVTTGGGLRQDGSSAC